jgi:hypothetical protein
MQEGDGKVPRKPQREPDGRVHRSRSRARQQLVLPVDVDRAAETDVDARRLLEESQQRRLDGAREVVKRLAKLGALTPTMSRVDAADVVWLATDPVYFDRLVWIRGWSVERFGAWLGRTLTTQLVI